jgi:hypothetical protein
MLLLCLPLLMGSVMGAPMRPEQIEELMQSMHRQEIGYSISAEKENGDDTIKDLD